MARTGQGQAESQNRGTAGVIFAPQAIDGLSIAWDDCRFCRRPSVQEENPGSGRGEFMGFWDAALALPIGSLLVLFIALTIAFGFEFINGFHDTANAVTTVIYTRALRPT